MRNQNIYTARITRGLVVGALGNSRPLGSIQRSFPVFAQNNGTTVTELPADDHQPAGGRTGVVQAVRAARRRSTSRCRRKSTVARTVFARSSDPHAQINVSVVEITAPGGAPVPNGQQGTIVLNPDPTNPGPREPGPRESRPREPGPRERRGPQSEIWRTRPSAIRTSRIPDLENPDLENPDLENTTRRQSRRSSTPISRTPTSKTRTSRTPTSRIPISRTSTSSMARSATRRGRSRTRATRPARTPSGSRSTAAPGRVQEPAHRAQDLPDAGGARLLAAEAVADGAARQHSQPPVRGRRRAGEPRPREPGPREPHDRHRARARRRASRCACSIPIKTDAVTFRAAESVTPVAVAQAVNTPEADQGITQPAAAGVLTSSAPVPGGTSGGDYTTTLTSTLPGTWTVAGGTVPPGLTVNPATGADHRHADHAGHLHVHRALPVDDRPHRLPDRDDHGRRGRRRGGRRRVGGRPAAPGRDRHARSPTRSMSRTPARPRPRTSASPTRCPRAPRS